MARPLGQIPDPEPEEGRPLPTWYHAPADAERIAWLAGELVKGQAEVVDATAEFYAELTSKQRHRLYGLALALQRVALAQRMIDCQHGLVCESPKLGLNAFTLRFGDGPRAPGA